MYCYLAPCSAAVTYEIGGLLPALAPVLCYCVAESGGVEMMVLTAIGLLGLEAGCTIFSYDGANASNVHRHRFLPALAEIIP